MLMTWGGHAKTNSAALKLGVSARPCAKPGNLENLSGSVVTGLRGWEYRQARPPIRFWQAPFGAR
jgi:hypothetical protein